MTPTKIDKKYSKVYLKNCKFCKEDFFTEISNKQYCSPKHQHEGVRESWRNTRRNQYRKNKKKESLKKKGTFDDRQTHPLSIIGYVSPETPNYTDARFYLVKLSIEKIKKQTFRTPYSKKGKQKTTAPQGAASSLPLQYQHVTDEDLHLFSVAYLKDNQVKCPECENKQNWIEHALNICSECGLVIKAPPIHPGYIVDDLLPKKKVAPTVQDLNLTEDLKGAHELAYTKYQEQIAVIDDEVEQNDLLNFDDNDPLNPVYWRNRKQKKCKQI
jgi:hypothetical protein